MLINKNELTRYHIVKTEKCPFSCKEFADAVPWFAKVCIKVMTDDQGVYIEQPVVCVFYNYPGENDFFECDYDKYYDVVEKEKGMPGPLVEIYGEIFSSVKKIVF